MNAPLAKEDIPAFLDRRPLVYTYTMLNTYRNVCAHQAERRYIRRDVPYVESPQMAWGNKVHSAFETRVQGAKPLPADMHQWESIAAAFDGRGAKTEAKLGITREGRQTGYWDKDVWLRGKADLYVLNESKDRAYLLDYKTGSVREDEFELAVQAVLLHAHYPGLTRIMGQFCWLKENRLGDLHDLSDTKATWEKICQLVRQIENDRARGVFDKEPGPLCGWCDVRDCENNRKPA